jgi:general secretion pathway protein H
MIFGGRGERTMGVCRARRGTTLIETLVSLAIIAIISGIAILSVGAQSSARLKRAAAQVAGSVRIAYAQSIASSKDVRLVYDFEQRTIALEESPQPHLIQRGVSGGASPATALEQDVEAKTAQVQKGPQAPKATFTPVKGRVFGFSDDTRTLPNGIGFWSVQTAHQDKPIGEGHAYLYFSPSGQTENAAIQVRISNSDESAESNYLTILVAPLTGRTQIVRGRIDMAAPHDDREASERADNGS